MGSSKFPTKINNGFKDDSSQEPLDKPLTSYEVKKKNRRQKINVYQHFSIMVQNNTTMLQQFVKSMFYSQVRMFKLIF